MTQTLKQKAKIMISYQYKDIFLLEWQMPSLCRINGNKKEYLVCYTLYTLGFNVHENSAIKMNQWKNIYDTPPANHINATKKILEKFKIKPGYFKINKDNMGCSKLKMFTTADIQIYPREKDPIHLSIKNNNSFLKSPCPNAFPEQAGLDNASTNIFKKKYAEINNKWHEDLQCKGGRFPTKMHKMENYTKINNLIKSFLITYGANAFVKFILDLNAHKYIIKYTKTNIIVYNIDINLDDYNIVIDDVQDTFLIINLEHKYKMKEAIQIKLRIKNYESFIRKKSKVLPIKYSVTLSAKCMDNFVCFKMAKEKQHNLY